MARTRRAASCLFAALGIATAAFACGGGEDGRVPPASETATASASATGSATAVGGLGSATPTPSPTPGQLEPPAVSAQSAAAVTFDAVIVPRGQRCAENNTEQRPCVGEVQNPEPERGIALVAITAPDDSGGFIAVMGRKADGGWGLWFTTQNVTFHRLLLPGDVRVCADGQRLNLREAPSTEATLVTQFQPDQVITVDGFQLGKEANPSLPLDREAFLDGWYHVSAPQSGWVHANFVSDTEASPDCALRDQAQE